jgi:hypothetical protein
MTAVSEDLMLTLLRAGRDLPWLSQVTGWPSRQVRIFASDHGYLIAKDGSTYRPPGRSRHDG